MIPPKEKARVPKDSMTLLPCFYFVEVGVGWVGSGGGCAGGSVPGPGTAGRVLCPVLVGLCGAITPGVCWSPLSPPQLPIVASSVVTLYFLELTDLFKPAKVGFQCHDRALSMPYVETNEELIPLLMLLSLAFAAPAASVRPGLSRCGGRDRARDWGPGGVQHPSGGSANNPASPSPT